MGLEAIPSSAWIEPDDGLSAFYRHKVLQREQRGDEVYRALPSSIAAQREFRDLLLRHLLTDHADVYRRDGDRLLAEPLGLSWQLADDDDLSAVALWIADDVVIMAPGASGYELVAGSVNSPSKWHLREKFGRDLLAIHAPLPGFATELGAAVQRLFEHLPPDRQLRRFIWSVQPGNQLYWDTDEPVTIDASTPLYWRVERQVLRRLPVSGAVAFTIRVYLHPLAELEREPRAMPALLAAIDAMPAPQAEYKEFARLEAALTPWRLRYPAAGG